MTRLVPSRLSNGFAGLNGRKVTSDWPYVVVGTARFLIINIGANPFLGNQV